MIIKYVCAVVRVRTARQDKIIKEYYDGGAGIGKH